MPGPAAVTDPRVHAELRLGKDMQVNRKRVERLMREEGLQGIYRRRGRRNLVNAATEEDLVRRQFTADAPDRLGLLTSSATRRSRTEWGWETFTAGPSQRPGSSWGQPDPGDAGEGGEQPRQRRGGSALSDGPGSASETDRRT